MGRKKIEIKHIQNKRSRLASFNKRRVGLFKKAYELAILTGTPVYARPHGVYTANTHAGGTACGPEWGAAYVMRNFSAA